MRCALLLLLVACGARTDLGGQREDASSPPNQQPGIVVNECAPNDGLQVTFVLPLEGATPLPACPSSLGGQGGIRISLWNPAPSAPGTYTIGDGSFPSGGTGSFCPLVGSCVMATGGTLTLTELTKTEASGSYTLVMPDNGKITGSFAKLPLCNNAIMCG